MNSAGHRKLGERGVQSLCVFQCLIKTLRQANPGIVLIVGFVLESNWFYQATVKLSLQNQCSWKRGIRK